MNDILPEMLNHVIEHIDLPSIINLSLVDKSLCAKVGANIVMNQRKTIKQELCGKYVYLNKIFEAACRQNFIVYVIYIVAYAKTNSLKLNYNIHNECQTIGHTELAQWLCQLTKLDGYYQRDDSCCGGPIGPTGPPGRSGWIGPPEKTEQHDSAKQFQCHYPVRQSRSHRSAKQSRHHGLARRSRNHR